MCTLRVNDFLTPLWPHISTGCWGNASVATYNVGARCINDINHWQCKKVRTFWECERQIRHAKVPHFCLLNSTDIHSCTVRLSQYYSNSSSVHATPTGLNYHICIYIEYTGRLTPTLCVGDLFYIRIHVYVHCRNEVLIGLKCLMKFVITGTV